MKIVWDEPKRRATLAARALYFAMVTHDFFESAKIQPAKHGRFLALRWCQLKASKTSNFPTKVSLPFAGLRLDTNIVAEVEISDR